MSRTPTPPGPLSKAIQLQLVLDIENNGGIECMDASDILEKLLDKRLEDEDNPYGPKGSTIRRKIQTKVLSWIQLHEEGRYKEEVLKRFGLATPGDSF